MFQNGSIPVINKPTRVTNKSITCIDHIYINSFFNHDISSGIIKTDISDHFPVFIIDNDINLKLTSREKKSLAKTTQNIMGFNNLKGSYRAKTCLSNLIHIYARIKNMIFIFTSHLVKVSS